MKKRSSIISLPGIVILVIMLTGLGLALWRQGGLAFSPGALSANSRLDVQIGGYRSHADFEKNCAMCHQPLTNLLADQCLACHANIEQEIMSQTGFHGTQQNIEQCAGCHSDHRGRDFDLRFGQLDDFDHSLLSFNLIRHQVDFEMEALDCLDCHLEDDRFSVSTESCTLCHAGNDLNHMSLHLQDFGTKCIDCHDGSDSLTRFEHAESKFPLVGSHETTECVDCHRSGQFEGLPNECVSCHTEPDVHQGIFGKDCTDCHNSSSWSPASLGGKQFDHSTQPGFSLILHTQDYSGVPISCTTCHPHDLKEFTPPSCVACHRAEHQAFIDQHQSQLGGNCLDCHDGVDRMHNFDHSDFFPLDGKHSQIDCQACHVEQVYKGTPRDCVDCHSEPQIHAGYFGLTCEYCHTSSSWYPAQLKSHQFPLDHGEQGVVECRVCHDSAYSQYSCYGCHDHQKNEIVEDHRESGIFGTELLACFQCHPDGSEH